MASGASSPEKQQYPRTQEATQPQDQHLPLHEQLRRFLCRSMFAVVNCRVNGRSVGGQKHVALRFPFFSTSTKHSIASPLPPEDLPPEVQQQHQQTDTVLASFQATMREPVSAISLHVGVTHPGKESFFQQGGIWWALRKTSAVCLMEKKLSLLRQELVTAPTSICLVRSAECSPQKLNA